MTEVGRAAVFIGHAGPENSVLAAWLGARQKAAVRSSDDLPDRITVKGRSGIDFRPGFQ